MMLKLLCLIPFLGSALAATKAQYVNAKVVTSVDYDATYIAAITKDDAGMLAAEEVFELLFKDAATTAVAAGGALNALNLEAASDGTEVTADVYRIESDGATTPKVKFMVEFAYTFTDENEATDANNKVVTDWAATLNSIATIESVTDATVADASTAGTGSIAFTAALVAGMLALRN